MKKEITLDTQSKIFLKSIGLKVFTNYKFSENKLIINKNWDSYLIKILKRYKKLINTLIKQIETTK